MKTKINIILFLFLLSAYSINAQKIWTECTINLLNNSIASKSQYWTTDDIIVDGYTYTKVVNKDRYLGAIREENGKVYALLEYGGYWDSGEFLLYDFTVQVGDVIKSTAIEGALSYPDGMTVIQIDEIILETGEKRKRFFFDITEPWIEGIGSTSGLFHDAKEHPTNYRVSYLVCFQQDNTPIYVNTEKCLDGRCCEELTNDDVAISNYQIDNGSIYPNPTKGITQITLPFEDTQKHLSIQILDSFGRILQNKVVPYQKQIEIDLSEYPSGLYCIAITSEGSNSFISYKVVKQ